MQKEKTPHPHAAMIAEWVQDTSRVVEFLGADYSDSDYRVRWVKCRTAPEWRKGAKYRFADTVKPEIVSSLSDDELTVISPMGILSPTDMRRRVANAAAARAIEELPLLGCGINGLDLWKTYRGHDGDVESFMEQIAIAVRDDYIQQVKEGKK